MTATTQRYRQGEVDQERLAAFRAKQVRSWLRSHPGDDAGAEQWANLAVASYGHQFRVLVPVS